MMINFFDVPTPPVMVMSNGSLYAGMSVLMWATMALVVIVNMFSVCGRFSQITANKKCEAKSRNQQPGTDAQPGVESFWEDPFRRVKRYNTERVDRNGMRRGDNSAQQYCVTGLPMRSNQVSGDKGLAMPRF